MLPLRLPIKVTLYKLRLSAYRNLSALLYHHRYDLASFFTAYHNYCENVRTPFPDFGLTNLRSTAHTFKNQTGYHFYTRGGHLESFEMWC
jgi:hypothetical protein